jgi:hexokinase
MDAEEMVKRIQEKKTLDDEWFTIRDEILQFLKEDHPEEEKRKFRPLGYLEVVTMICDGLERR